MSVVRVNPYAPLKSDSFYARDTKQCTVVTLMVATGRPYRACYDYLKSYGRMHRKGMCRDDWSLALYSMKKFRIATGDYDMDNRITIGNFIKKHPVGTFFCASRGHAFAIVDGVLHDHSDKLRRQITIAYRLYKREDKDE